MVRRATRTVAVVVQPVADVCWAALVADARILQTMGFGFNYGFRLRLWDWAHLRCCRRTTADVVAKVEDRRWRRETR